MTSHVLFSALILDAQMRLKDRSDKADHTRWSILPHRVFYTMVRLTSYGIKNNLDNDSGLVGQVKAYMEGVFNMKKWFRPVRAVKKYIDIVVNMDDYKDYKTDTSVAVNPYFPMKVSRPSAIKDWKISDEALSLYINFLNCVLHIIWSHGLKITKQYWAKKTYTYNIEVKHYGYIHDEKVKYIILFRVNNHINPTLNRGPKFNGGREMTMPVLQDIRVGKFESSIYPDAMFYINKICKGIKENDEAAEATLAAWREQYCDADRPQKGDAVE